MANERVVMTDVGPRDGLQNQPKILSVAERVQLVQAIAASGLNQVEVGSFVSPKAVPAMANTDQVAQALNTRGNPDYSALVPNFKGYELARDAGIATVAMVVYGSETMAQKNVRMGKDAAEQATLDIVKAAKEDGIKVIATVAVAFECPFDGPTDPAVVEGLTERMLAAGVDDVVIADTIGAGNPSQVMSLMKRLVVNNGADRLGCHFHDTRAMGLANVYAGLEAGIRKFDASIAGLGGCPFAPGASGNVATEDVVMMLHQMGLDTGIDLAKLMAASALAEELSGSAPGGRAKPWLQRHLAKMAECGVLP